MPSPASLPWSTPAALTIVRQAPRCAVLNSQRTGGAELAGFPSRNVTHRRWRRAKDPPLGADYGAEADHRKGAHDWAVCAVPTVDSETAWRTPGRQGSDSRRTPTRPGRRRRGLLRERAARNPQLVGHEPGVVHLVARGLSDAEIAAGFHLSEATVKSHVARVLAERGCVTASRPRCSATRTGSSGPGARGARTADSADSQRKTALLWASRREPPVKAACDDQRPDR